MDRRAFVWRLLGALAAPAGCWRPPGMEPLTDPTLGISMRFIKAFEPLQFHGDAFALAMEPRNGSKVFVSGVGVYVYSLKADSVLLDLAREID